MPVATFEKPDLEIDRDNAIIEHVLRSSITTMPVLEELFFAGLHYDTARKVVRRLVKARFLTRYPLFGNFDYFRLGQAAISRWGYPRTRVPALGTQRLPYELGALAYCSMDSQAKRTRLHASEICSSLPWFPESLTQWAYFVEQNVLHSIRVEITAFGSAVLQKLGQQLYEYTTHPDFRQMVENRNFAFVVVTASERQELALKTALASEPFPVRVRTEHYPELARFV